MKLVGKCVCDEEIFVAVLENSGKPMAINAKPDPEGTLIVVGSRGDKLLVRALAEGEIAPPGHRRFRFHFATCKWSKRKEE